MISEGNQVVQSADRWRVSHFVTREGRIIHHDLLDRSRELSDAERTVLDAAFTTTISRTDLSWCPIPRETAEIAFTVLAQEGWLVPEGDDESAAWRIQKVDIETCTHCNARCRFCPQSSGPKSASVMSEQIFRKIVYGIASHHPQWVALNHYGEPLLDPFFRFRCELLRELGLPLYLFTNATLLNGNLIDFILQTCSIYGIVFNYPSVRSEEWANLMHLPESLHRSTTSAIRAAAQGFRGRIRILVNGITECQGRRAAEIKRAFEDLVNVEVFRWNSNDRAGSHSVLTIVPEKNGADRLCGCPRILTHMHFNVEGRAFLCCQDYHQTVVLGSIQESSPSEIMSGVIAADLRRQIYGMGPALPSLMCRSCDRLRKARSHQ